MPKHKRHIPQGNACMIPNTQGCKIRIPQSKSRQKILILTTLACQFGRCMYVRLLFGTTLAGYMLQMKISKIIKELIF